MKQIHLKLLIMTLIVQATFGLVTAAYAQYVWVDEKGVRQYSDMPPPPNVPQHRILKEPRRNTSSAAPQSTDNSESVSTATIVKTPLTAAEKNAGFQKRKAEQAEKEKKATEQERQSADNAKNCERAHAYQHSLESGERISRTGKNGEHAFLTDEQRAQEIRDTKHILEECK